MMTSSRVRSTLRFLGAAGGLAVGVYATWVGIGWFRYGLHSQGDSDERDEILERFIPVYEVVERHSISVNAPAAITFAAAREQDLLQSPPVRAIIATRAAVLGAVSGDGPSSRGLLAEMLALGWGVLAEIPGREIVMGAITRPWEADVTFRALPPEEFAAFREPGFVKIAWTLRADPLGDGKSIFRTETRAVATDPVARARFRRYWAFVSPGIATIRWVLLRPLKNEAERRFMIRSK